MTARNALNTYETVPDLPENTYATVSIMNSEQEVTDASCKVPVVEEDGS